MIDIDGCGMVQGVGRFFFKLESELLIEKYLGRYENCLSTLKKSVKFTRLQQARLLKKSHFS
jgi:hypothetical protein